MKNINKSESGKRIVLNKGKIEMFGFNLLSSAWLDKLTNDYDVSELMFILNDNNDITLQINQ